MNNNNFEYQITTISSEHDNDMCSIIKNVGIEFGAIGEGFGPSDDEVLAMSRHYDSALKSKYLVLLLDGKVVGGCGIAPFNGSSTVSELRKLFLLPEARGKGLGKLIAQQALTYAANFGYSQCYLDTLSNMTSAINLYQKLGFTRLAEPLEGTEHNGCNVWMLKVL